MATDNPTAPSAPPVNLRIALVSILGQISDAHAVIETAIIAIEASEQLSGETFTLRLGLGLLIRAHDKLDSAISALPEENAP